MSYIPEDGVTITLTDEEAIFLDTILYKVEVGPLKRIYNKVHLALEKEKEEEMIA